MLIKIQVPFEIGFCQIANILKFQKPIANVSTDFEHPDSWPSTEDFKAGVVSHPI